jgi:hypothetical protein
MARKDRDEGDRAGRTKVHSLGYMEEKLKNNLPNCEHRYLLTCTTFIIVGGQYGPSSKTDPRIQNVEEMILCSMGIEKLCDEVYNYQRRGMKAEMKGKILVSGEVAEARRLLDKVKENRHSMFYDQLRYSLEDSLRAVGSDDFQKRARQIGKGIRDAVRQELAYVKEKKLYIRDAGDINLADPVIITIEREIEKVRRALFEGKD